MTELSSQEVAQRIGVSMSTLKNWAVRLPVPSSLGPDGARNFPQEALEVLAAVKALRDENRSYETIRRTITPRPDDRPVEELAPELAAAPAPELAAAAAPELPAEEAAGEAAAPIEPLGLVAATVTTALEAPATPELAVVMARVLEVLNEQNTLSEAYASTRQRVGELEMALRMAQEERVRLQQELAEARERADTHETRLARRKPWWMRWFDFE